MKPETSRLTAKVSNEQCQINSMSPQTSSMSKWLLDFNKR